MALGPPPSVAPPGFQPVSPTETVSVTPIKEEKYHILTPAERVLHNKRCDTWKSVREATEKNTHPHDKACAEYNRLKLVSVESRLQETLDKLTDVQNLYHASQAELQNRKRAHQEVRDANARLQAELDLQKRKCEDLDTQSKKARKEIDTLEAAKYNLMNSLSGLQAQHEAMVTEHDVEMKQVVRSLKEEKGTRERSDALLKGIQQQLVTHFK